MSNSKSSYLTQWFHLSEVNSFYLTTPVTLSIVSEWKAAPASAIKVRKKESHLIAWLVHLHQQKITLIAWWTHTVITINMTTRAVKVDDFLENSQPLAHDSSIKQYGQRRRGAKSHCSRSSRKIRPAFVRTLVLCCLVKEANAFIWHNVCVREREEIFIFFSSVSCALVQF